jgi:predicted metal-binding protein
MTGVLHDPVTVVTVCDTCKREGWQAGQGTTDGEALAALVEAAAQDRPDVTVRRHSCLMGCAGACNVAIQGYGKIAYTLGRFDPTRETAEGIVAYAALHAESDTGQVPFRTWPVAIKGHFVTRHPPLPKP